MRGFLEGEDFTAWAAFYSSEYLLTICFVIFNDIQNESFRL